MRVAVLGGAGFMGSNFVRYLMKSFSDVDVYDKLTYADRLENLHDVLQNSRLRFVEGDICNEEFLEIYYSRCPGVELVEEGDVEALTVKAIEILEKGVETVEPLKIKSWGEIMSDEIEMIIKIALK
jgi:UDP-N-acetylmuramoylalanine-D-glutamate ligase